MRILLRAQNCTFILRSPLSDPMSSQVTYLYFIVPYVDEFAHVFDGLAHALMLCYVMFLFSHLLELIKRSLSYIKRSHSYINRSQTCINSSKCE